MLQYFPMCLCVRINNVYMYIAKYEVYEHTWCATCATLVFNAIVLHDSVCARLTIDVA